VLLFRTITTKVEGSTHRPTTLLVQYGSFISTCKLERSTVTYTMFDLTGLPIRAKISASFKEETNPTLGAILSMLSSPDLTHEVTVTDGDTLPLLTNKVYGDQMYYIQAARVNRLKNFRKLAPGSKLVFPPIAKK
jgi:nucleoid-associated protein YgaU